VKYLNRSHLLTTARARRYAAGSPREAANTHGDSARTSQCSDQRLARWARSETVECAAVIEKAPSIDKCDAFGCTGSTRQRSADLQGWTTRSTCAVKKAAITLSDLLALQGLVAHKRTPIDGAQPWRNAPPSVMTSATTALRVGGYFPNYIIDPADPLRPGDAHCDRLHTGRPVLHLSRASCFSTLTSSGQRPGGKGATRAKLLATRCT
jgi:hypothetical protein